MGLELFGPEDEHANVVTAMKAPDGVDGAKIPKTMRDNYGITIAGGQGHLKGKIVRIAHCGYYGAFDILDLDRGARDDARRARRTTSTFGAGVAARAGGLPRRRRAAAQPVA